MWIVAAFKSEKREDYEMIAAEKSIGQSSFRLKMEQKQLKQSFMSSLMPIW